MLVIDANSETFSERKQAKEGQYQSCQAKYHTYPGNTKRKL